MFHKDTFKKKAHRMGEPYNYSCTKLLVKIYIYVSLDV
jgi:hypothetical protein